MTPRGKRLGQVFHLTEEMWERMYVLQGGCCGICKRPLERPKCMTDHRHADGLVRGLLCFRCNKAIALFDNDLPLIVAAVAYLTNPPATSALGYAHHGLPGRVGTKKARKLARKLRKHESFVEAAAALKDTMPVLSRLVHDAYSIDVISKELIASDAKLVP